jgi:5-(carboxyamino)imidazole ribonucleotide synthase
MATRSHSVGIIGGGQLAWMLALEAKPLGLDLIVQTPSPADPAVGVVGDAIFAAIDDAAATAQLSDRTNVITFENEFIDLDALQQLSDRGVCFRPGLHALRPLLDKYDQRQTFQDLGLPTPRFSLPTTIEQITADYGFPLVLKARRYGYDGRGTFIVKTAAELAELWQGWNHTDLLIEAFVPFERELAVMVARSVTGEVQVYPVVETQQVEQVCRRVFAPAPIDFAIQTQVEQIATTLVTALDVVGIFGIELFLTADGQVWVNEIAPRTHNSGHYTLNACDVSQFSMQLRAVTGQALPRPRWTCAGAVMVNLLGFETSRSGYLAQREAIAKIPGASVWWYGKPESRPGRKLGHVTVCLTAETLDQGDAIAAQIEHLWQGNPS